MFKNLYRELLQAAEKGQTTTLVTRFPGKVQEGDCRQNYEKYMSENTIKDEPVVVTEGELYCFYEPVAAGERLIILGGGHIALPLCEMAARTGFKVTVVDDRPEFANKIRFPWAEMVLCDHFLTALEQVNMTERDYIAVLTRGHRYDAACLRFLLNGREPHYLGMIGSRRRIRGLFDMLEEEGYAKEKLQRICSPIGLDIGAVLPEEIAVSILAELIAYRRKEKGRQYCHTDLDYEVIRYLAEAEEPLAVVTVMETKGSVPRRAGAKMAVTRYGKVFGSIGGGCAEKEIIDKAVRLVGRARWQIAEVDLTGDVAESEGMVCGGIMRVLIETEENR